MDNEIEKLKQERDEILAKALRLIELDAMAWEGTAISRKDWDAAVAELQALRPKPKPLELWVNEESYGTFEAFPSRSDALRCGEELTRTAVHMREVLPAPKWERWNSDSDGVVKTESGRSLTGYVGTVTADTLCQTHNAEMERLAAMWEGGAE